MKVIVTGMPRTGTMSMKMALQLLGLGRCYHTDNLLDNPDEYDYIFRSAKGDRVEWKNIFDGYQSICLVFTREKYSGSIFEYYPDAKIVHTVREPESWYESMNATLLNRKIPIRGLIQLIFKIPFSRLHRKRILIVLRSVFSLRNVIGKQWKSKNNTIESYNNYNQMVCKILMHREVLFYDVTQGWRPLCDFLQVPIPSIDFPHKNKRNEFVDVFLSRLLEE